MESHWLSRRPEGVVDRGKDLETRQLVAVFAIATCSLSLVVVLARRWTHLRLGAAVSRGLPRARCKGTVEASGAVVEASGYASGESGDGSVDGERETASRLRTWADRPEASKGQQSRCRWLASRAAAIGSWSGSSSETRQAWEKKNKGR